METRYVCVTLLVLVVIQGYCCEGCWKQERDNLLHLKAHLSKLPSVSSWGVSGIDCCRWEGVKCNPRTGRVSHLAFDGFSDYWLGNWYLNFSNFLVFEDLKTFKLTGPTFAGCVHNEGTRLINLEVVDLSDNLLSDDGVLSCLGGLSLSSLKSLYLANNDLTLQSVHSFESLTSKLSNLEILDLSWNHFNDSGNDSAFSLSGLPSLKYLSLSHCDLSTRSVYGLSNLSSLENIDLSENYMNNSILSSLSGLQHVKSLDLSYNPVEGLLDTSDFADMDNLEVLILHGAANIGIEFFQSIGALTSLKILSMSECGISGTLPTAVEKLICWSELRMLEELDLSHNKFEGKLPSTFGNMTSLQMLEISNNYFTGNFPSIISLTSLEYLSFRENHLQFPSSFISIANCSSLKFIYGDGNKVIPDLDSTSTSHTWVPKFQLQVVGFSSTTVFGSSPLPNFLLYQYNLTVVDITGWNFSSEFPNWLLQNNTKLINLVLKNCPFRGHFQLPRNPIPNIRSIDLSDNYITQILDNNVSSMFPKLQLLNMSKNAMTGSVPHEFGQMQYLDTLDLSNNCLSEIPNNIFITGRSRLRILNLSRNKLSGQIPFTLSSMNHLKELYLDGNDFSGSIPTTFPTDSSPLTLLSLSRNKLSGEVSHILSTLNEIQYLYLDGNGFSGNISSTNPKALSLLILDLSNNHITGKLPRWIRKMPYLISLSLSNNHFRGSIPTAFVQHESLWSLDLSKNDLFGSIPSLVRSSARYIHLNNNRFSSLAARMFDKESSIVILDISNNHISGNIEDLLGDLPHLNILILKANRFSGQIPKQFCQLTLLTIVDLSENNISGPIPACMGNLLNFMIDNDPREVPLSELQANLTTKGRSYTYHWKIMSRMMEIDLSHNKFYGNIPNELGNLTKMKALNLSHNHLTGKIPATFSNLENILSLDLSFNKLSGSIPPQLTELSFLAVFSVANNNLSGTTPDRRGQFSTFEESSYEGNPLLCGPPLQKSCTMDHHPVPVTGQSTADSPNIAFDDFVITFAVAYTSVLLVITAVLTINPHWRRAWFHFIQFVIDSCYYFVIDNFC